ncbi:MAG: protein kinase [Phycisphaerae bacterium]|nr:protein kinase [Phycisphaerae bacterium]
MAHARGIMHCDLKPGNVLVADDGTLKLADFDLAKPIEPVAAAERGTPAFAAPEQLGPDAVGALPLSDVYGLAGILFWLLTSTAPNGSDGLPRTDHRSLLQAASTPPRLADIILRSLQSEPERRHGSAQEFADDLRRWLDDAAIRWLPSSARDTTRRWVRRHPVRAVMLSLVGIATALGVASGAVLWRSEEVRRTQLLEDRLAAAQQELDDTHRALRNELHTVGEALMTRAATARESELLAALAWLERLGAASLIGPNGDRIPIAYQRDALFELVRRLDAAGQGRSLRAALAKDALARAQEDLGSRDEAARLFGEIEAAWAGRLESGDPFLESVRAGRQRSAGAEARAAEGGVGR